MQDDQTTIRPRLKRLWFKKFCPAVTSDTFAAAHLPTSRFRRVAIAAIELWFSTVGGRMLLQTRSPGWGFQCDVNSRPEKQLARNKTHLSTSSNVSEFNLHP